MEEGILCFLWPNSAVPGWLDVRNGRKKPEKRKNTSLAIHSMFLVIFAAI